MGSFSASRSIVPGSTTLGSNKHIVCVDQEIRYADSSDNTVIVQLPNVKIPAGALVHHIAATVKELSNLATHEVNIHFSTDNGTAADAAIENNSELLGAGAAVTDSTDSASASDISLGTSADDGKEGWSRATAVPSRLAADQYVYICNAGTSNGTTNSTAGVLSVVIEYYGID
jgi:hypothetical protein